MFARSAFLSRVDIFSGKRSQLLNKLDEAIIMMPTKKRATLSEADIPVRQTRNRYCPCNYDQTSKHPRLISDTRHTFAADDISTSPGVQVSRLFLLPEY